jgi:hypothetical protein
MKWSAIAESLRNSERDRKAKQSRYTPWWRLGGEELYLLPILDLGTRWGWVVSVTPRPRFYPRGKDPRYPSYRRLGGPKIQRLEENSLASAGDRTAIVQSVARHYTTWATRLLTLCIPIHISFIPNTVIHWLAVLSDSLPHFICSYTLSSLSLLLSCRLCLWSGTTEKPEQATFLSFTQDDVFDSEGKLLKKFGLSDYTLTFPVFPDLFIMSSSSVTLLSL